MFVYIDSFVSGTSKYQQVAALDLFKIEINLPRANLRTRRFQLQNVAFFT